MGALWYNIKTMKYIYIDKKTGKKVTSDTPLPEKQYKLLREVGKIIQKV
jgi:hypothetical protein